jgi:hypothetical protein
MRNTARTAFARWSPAACARFGSEAYAYATAAAAARAQSDADWHDLTISTDRDDATRADRDPLGTMSG